MRVNMDSSVASDPRFKLVAATLGIKCTEVIGSCFLLWLACYERRSERLRKVEADVAADLSGFSEALVAENLADDCGDGTIIVHGVIGRIEFLKKQAERGAKGGKSKKKPGKKANAKQPLPQPPSTDDQSAQAYTPTLTPDLSPTPTPDQDIGARGRAHQLPSDWQPSEAHRVLATECQVNLVLEADKFRDHYAATGKAMKDWNASFRNWLRNSAKFSGGGSKSSNQAGFSAEDLWRMSQEQS